MIKDHYITLEQIAYMGIYNEIVHRAAAVSTVATQSDPKRADGFTRFKEA